MNFFTFYIIYKNAVIWALFMFSIQKNKLFFLKRFHRCQNTYVFFEAALY